MTSAIPVHVAIVDDTGTIPTAELAEVAGALSAQITRDFAPVWGLRASVGAYPKAPAHTWAVHIQNQLDEPGALGYHTDDTKQPVSYVEKTADYSVTVSHETLEMLADPWGNRMHGARPPQGITPAQIGGATRVQYLLEVCDPPEADSYEVGGVAVSDWLMPEWYYSLVAPGARYSHTGFCTKPRQVAEGGYVSFANASGEWFQVMNNGGTLSLNDLGHFDSAKFGSLREFADYHARQIRSGQSGL